MKPVPHQSDIKMPPHRPTRPTALAEPLSRPGGSHLGLTPQGQGLLCSILVKSADSVSLCHNCHYHCVTLDNSLNLSDSQHPYLSSGDNNYSTFQGAVRTDGVNDRQALAPLSVF